MAVIIDGTNGITSVNGTAAAPSVTGTDTDTGIVYGTNTLSLATGGATAVTVDSSQNVGIGTSSPATKLNVSGGSAGAAFDAALISNADTANTSGSAATLYLSGSNGTARSTFIQGINTGGATNAQALAFATSGAYASPTERMRIDSSGNVGIGTSSPSQKLHVYGATSTYGRIESVNAGTGAGLTFKNATSNWLIGAGPASGLSEFAIIDQTSGSVARLYIDTSGNLQFNSGYGSVATAYGCRAWVNFNGTGTVAIRASGNVGSITDNGTGDYTVNFSSAMPDANYAPEIAITKAGANTSSGGIAAASVSSAPTLMSTTQLRVVTGSDAYVCAVSILR